MLHTGAVSHPHWLCPSLETQQEFPLFLSFSVLTFTGETSSPNALVKVTKEPHKLASKGLWALLEQSLSYWKWSIAQGEAQL